MRRILAGTAVVLAVWAQSPKRIEVASVKSSRDTMADSNLDSTRGRLTGTNITLLELIRLAYDVKTFQIQRAPKWVETERFDIAAKIAAPASDKLNDLKALLRELLETRFQLITHRETKEIPVYLLLVAKDGPKLTPHDDAGPRTRGGCGRLVGRRVTADAIAPYSPVRSSARSSTAPVCPANTISNSTSRPIPAPAARLPTATQPACLRFTQRSTSNSV